MSRLLVSLSVLLDLNNITAQTGFKAAARHAGNPEPRAKLKQVVADDLWAEIEMFLWDKSGITSLSSLLIGGDSERGLPEDFYLICVWLCVLTKQRSRSQQISNLRFTVSSDFFISQNEGDYTRKSKSRPRQTRIDGRILKMRQHYVAWTF